MTYHRRSTSEDRRRHVRFATAFEAKLVQSERLQRVTVGDISVAGALLEGLCGAKAGQRVRLRANDLDIDARIAWVGEDVCGLCFAYVVNPFAIVRASMPYFQGKAIGRTKANAAMSEFAQGPIVAVQ